MARRIAEIRARAAGGRILTQPALQLRLIHASSSTCLAPVLSEDSRHLRQVSRHRTIRALGRTDTRNPARHQTENETLITLPRSGDTEFAAAGKVLTSSAQLR